MYVPCHESHYVHELEFYFTNKKCFETGRVLKNNHVKKEKIGKSELSRIKKNLSTYPTFWFITL